MASHASKSAAIRARLNHPVVDADGHWVEYEPVLTEYLREAMGNRAAERLLPAIIEVQRRYYGTDPTMSFEQRQATKMAQHAWWFVPTANTLDRATAMMPKLLDERLARWESISASCSRPCWSRCRCLKTKSCAAAAATPSTPTPPIFPRLQLPAHAGRVHPDAYAGEAIAELEHAKALGLKAVMLSGPDRPPGACAGAQGARAARYALWRDPLALDSDYDYDPVWAKCLELKLAPTFHASSAGLSACAPRSPTWCTTISAILARPAKRCASRCFWAA